MAKAATLNIDIAATADKALEAFDKVKEKSSSSWSAMKVGATVAAGAVLAGLGEATKAAAEHEAGVAKLTQAYKNAGLSTDDLHGSLEELDASSRKTGQSAEDNLAAYTKLIAATHSVTTAHQELATAQDLAAFKGVSVATAADAITKANEGNTRALKEMGIATTDTSGKQLSSAALMAKLTEAVHGQAAAFGQTAEGQMARYQESLEQTKVAIGEALLPALQSILNMLQPLFAWLSRNQAIVSVLARVIAVAAVAIVGLNVALRAWAAIQAVVNAVMSANPIGIVIIAIAALAVGVVLIIKHWRDFQGIVNDAWAVIRALGAWILAHWKVIVDVLLGPLGLVITNFRTIINVVNDVIGALERVGGAVDKALSFLKKLPSKGGSILNKLDPFGNPFSVAPSTATPVLIQVTATPGSDLPEVVYNALRDYQRRHVRPELRPLFGR